MTRLHKLHSAETMIFKQLNRIILAVTLCTFASLFFAPAAQAASVSWDGGGDGSSWSDATNWSGDAVPGADDDVTIDMSSVTVNIGAATTINSLTLGNASGTTDPILNFSYDASLAPLVIDDGDFTIYTNSVLTHTAGTTAVQGKIYVDVQSGDMFVYGSINVEGKGFQRFSGDGKPCCNERQTGGASHGGIGGNGNSGTYGAGSTTIYGSETAPVTYGSGGGYDNGAGTGSDGGGAVRLTVNGTLTVNGSINANGEIAYEWSIYSAGAASGGSIWLDVGTLEGTGSVTANGGDGGINYSYESAAGGGGRIAIYYDTDSNDFSALSADAGALVNGTTAAGDGTLYLVGKVGTPFNTKQFKNDGITAIGTGGETDEVIVKASFQVADGDNPETLTPEVEVREVGTDFSDVATHTGDDITYSGGAGAVATVSMTGLVDGASYHWQMRACDDSSQCSEWLSYGGNAENAADFTVNQNTLPNNPTIPGSSFFIGGQYTNDAQPSISFVLSDENSGDSVKYQIQIADNAGFTSPAVNYESALGAQGTFTFTVGQAEGTGSYTAGTEGQELTSGNYYWRVKAIDSNDGESSWTTASGTPAFIVDLVDPTSASNVVVKATAGASSSYSSQEDAVWMSSNSLYFDWDAGTDASGVKGYCLYLGTNPVGDAATDSGILGSSPVSTTGSTCEFIVEDTEVDFANTALRSYDWLQSSSEPYYFKIKTIDEANNIFDGSETTNSVPFYFDKTAPSNVSALSATSGSLSSVGSMFISWPTSGDDAAGDAHSGILGFQYGINSRNTWYGANTDDTTGLKYTSLGVSQPFYFPSSVHNLVNLGQNTIYFRVLDIAGNVSELRSAIVNFGGSAPEFAEDDEVIVTPERNTENSFAFSWPEASPSAGRTVSKYYYMFNTTPPSQLSTITSNSATYKSTTGRSISAGRMPGLIKGTNTIYVVAVDDNNNYSQSNSIRADFVLDTELPDPPSNVTVADNSIKSASLWRASIVWEAPSYKGTGDLTYVVQRSVDGDEWEDVTTTTGNAYVDTVSESKQYYWRVGTMDNSDESIAAPSYSSAVTLTPKGAYTEPADLTSNPAASNITTTDATISWTTSRESDSRVLYGLKSGSYFEAEPSKSDQVTQHSIPLDNLEPGTKYFYKVRWTDEDGNTGESDEYDFATAPPPEVKNVEVSSIGVSTAIVNFTTTNASQAKVYFGPSTDFGGVRELSTSQLESTYTVELTELQDGTEYYYRINTIDSEGNEYEGTILRFQTLPRPVVSNIQVEQISNTAQTSIVVTWQSNTPITSVVTYYPQNQPELVRDQVDISLADDDHSMIIKGLFPDTTYLLRVSGRDAIGNEAVSEPITVTTALDSRPPAISALSVEGANIDTVRDLANPSQLIVSWTTDEPSTSQIEFGEGTGTSYTQQTQEDMTLSFNHVVVIPNLSPSKVYHLRAISRDSAGNESRSVDTVTITPKATDQALDLVITNLRDAFGFLGDFL